MLTRTRLLYVQRSAILDAKQSLNSAQLADRISRAASVLLSNGVGRADFDALIECAPVAEIHEAMPEDEALLFYKGGTTGRSKGVPLSHLNIMTNALQLGFKLSPRSDDSARTFLKHVPSLCRPGAMSFSEPNGKTRMQFREPPS